MDKNIDINAYYCKDSQTCIKADKCKQAITKEVALAHAKARATIKTNVFTPNCYTNASKDRFQDY